MGELERTPSLCSDIQEDLPLFVFGSLDGLRQVRVRAHIDLCQLCASRERDLQGTADALLSLAPRYEPPSGFEGRILSVIASETEVEVPHRRTHSRRRLVTACALLFAAMLGFLGGRVSLAGHPNAPLSQSLTPKNVRTLLSPQGPIGTVSFDGTPSQPWMFMSVHGAHFSGDVLCEVVTTTGQTIDLGHFWISGGVGAWGSALSMELTYIRDIKLVNQGGAVLANSSLVTKP